MSIRCEGCGLEYAGGRGLDGLFAQRRRVARPALPADAAAGPPLPPRAPGASCGPSPEDDLDDVRRVPGRRAASPTTSSATSRCPLVVLRLVRRRGDAPCTTPRATCSAFLDHHGMLSGRRLAARGAPSSAARAPTSTRSAARLPDGPRARTRSPPSPATPTASRCATPPATVTRVRPRRHRHPRRPGAGACSPTPTDDEKARRSARSATPATRPCCTRRLGPARGARGAGLVELPDGHLRRAGATAPSSATG